ncbi:MAG: oxygen-sensitive ribonucleoside-triphosphate reductase, ribonucleoside-diphosphate reductase alpha [Gammaproteobacteria bacterium]|jgi:ribonucleoside-diphosphate reductase alpha chain|nr:oxygen-sensitive ribonucleoside-triphosphate reductase, ribonucleoside-diphosphate reductase alpha [Gammaproteobacteria bacterium]
MSATLKNIVKRNGNVVEFDIQRIVKAIKKAMDVAKEGNSADANRVGNHVLFKLEQTAASHHHYMPTVEGVQDDVEEALIEAGFAQAAKAYILYRKEHSDLRQQRNEVPEHIKNRARESSTYFRSKLNEFVYLRTYARWIESENRRETWIETVDRYIEFMRDKVGTALSESEYSEVREAILKQDVMPSMRLLQFAGPAAGKTNVCAYNCSYIAPKKLKDFSEVMYVSMCGTGVGFSVETQNIQTLPIVAYQSGEVLASHIVEDSKEGWCDALYLGLTTWYEGKDISFDYSRLRPAGARLKTMGGKSSGPEPLRTLLQFARQKILSRQGRRLSNIDAHDILCKIGEIVVAGGVRRSAMISLSDLDDDAMRDAKKGPFYYSDPQRSLANNSAVYENKPTNKQFLEEWIALMKSGSGERGIFNRYGLIKTLPKRRISVLEKAGYVQNDRIVGSIGTNPCGEIILQSKQFCNLSEVIARAEDDAASLKRKLKLATLLGTFQSTLTHFPYLSKKWKTNCENERLLGVSVTGQWDCEAVRDEKTLAELRELAVLANQEYAKRFGINASTCITCVKPSGTVSQTVDCASGMHARHAPYYIRRIRIAATDALYKMLKDQGVPVQPEVGQTAAEATTFVLEFPVKSPNGAVCGNQISAMQQLEHWKKVKLHYTEHNPSVTISVDEDEWIPVANWIYANWEIVGGLSFLPRMNHVYQLAPYEAITQEEYERLLQTVKNIDFSQLYKYEITDETEVKRELACVGELCEIV